MEQRKPRVLKFTNGSRIEILPAETAKRSKRGERQIKTLTDFYSKYPDLFLEDYYRIRLSWWQKCFLRLIRDKV